MKRSIIRELLLYRYRYAVGYILFFLVLAGLIVIAGLFVPGALTQAEMDSAVASSQISLLPEDITALPVINLPYHLLQKASIGLLGLSELSIKLPSLILAFTTGVGFMLLLRHWFTNNIAILTAIIAVAASQFLILAQTGTPLIMLLFWPTLLLFIATQLSESKTRFRFGWMLLFGAILALSLYTPLSIYVIIAMFIASLLHPHLRYMLKHIPKKYVAIGSIVIVILLVPLGWGIYLAPQSGFALLGVPDSWPTWAGIWENVMYLAHAFFGFASPTITGDTLLPLYGLSTSVLILLGILRLVVDHHSARTYAIGLWSIFLLLALILQPESVSILFIPLLLMLAIGLTTLFHEWYSLFPRNPYARIAALLPIAILLGVMVTSGVERYQNSYRYDVEVAQYFTTDLQLATSVIASYEEAPVTLLVQDKDAAFYRILESSHNLTVATDLSARTANETFIANEDALRPNTVQRLGTPARIVTNTYANDALRFRIYE